jgi:hypothetical protein
MIQDGTSREDILSFLTEFNKRFKRRKLNEEGFKDGFGFQMNSYKYMYSIVRSCLLLDGDCGL